MCVKCDSLEIRRYGLSGGVEEHLGFKLSTAYFNDGVHCPYPEQETNY